MRQPLDPDTLAFGLASATDPQLSPDGGRILYTLARPDTPSCLIVYPRPAPSSTGRAPRP